jgi:hypothetical protein
MRGSLRVITDNVAAGLLIAWVLGGCTNDFEQSLDNGAELLDGEQLEDLISGNTLVGTVNQFVPLEISFARDGQVIFKDDFHERAGVWSIDEQGRLCMSFDEARDLCTQFYREGGLLKAFTDYGRVVAVLEIAPDRSPSPLEDPGSYP